MSNKNWTLKLPQEMIDRINKLAEKQMVPARQMIRGVITDYLDEKAPLPLTMKQKMLGQLWKELVYVDEVNMDMDQISHQNLFKDVKKTGLAIDETQFESIRAEDNVLSMMAHRLNNELLELVLNDTDVIQHEPAFAWNDPRSAIVSDIEDLVTAVEEKNPVMPPQVLLCSPHNKRLIIDYLVSVMPWNRKWGPHIVIRGLEVVAKIGMPNDVVIVLNQQSDIKPFLLLLKDKCPLVEKKGKHVQYSIEYVLLPRMPESVGVLKFA